jgi:hypothetical protein
MTRQKTKEEWKIESDRRYQEYLNKYNGAIELLPDEAPIGYKFWGKRKYKQYRQDLTMAHKIEYLFWFAWFKKQYGTTYVRVAKNKGIRDKNGNELNRSKVMAILQNPLYAGFIRDKNGNAIPYEHILPVTNMWDYDSVQSRNGWHENRIEALNKHRTRGYYE